MKQNLSSSSEGGELILKNVKTSDMSDLFKWRNHPAVRKNSFNTKPILYAEHKKWFREKVKDQKCVMYIAYCTGKKIGSIRFENGKEEVKTSVILNPDCWGKGFGSRLIRLGTKRFIKEKNPGKPIHAEIKKDNIASLKAFQKAGFEESYLVFVYSK